MVGSVFLTGIFAMYGGLSAIGRLTHRAGMATQNTLNPDHQAPPEPESRLACRGATVLSMGKVCVRAT